MSTFKPTFTFFGAVAILSTALATPLLAQQAMSEPAYCAFFYPNANCQNKGPGNPYTDPNYHRNAAQNAWSSGETVGVAAGKRSRTHRSSPSATRMQ
jgi:ABC-type multidrug transport system permease subunit